MSRLFSTAVSSMQAHAQGIDVHANNVANINTTGYKAQRAQFETLFSQTLRGAAGPQTDVGGSDPMEIGAGVQMGATQTLFHSGSTVNTGQNLDLAIMGRGFFMGKDAAGNMLYTRDGALGLDANGRLVHTASGMAIQGLLVDPATDSIPDNALPTDIIIPPNMTQNARATSSASIAGNLDASVATGDSTQMQYRYYDSFGVAQVMTVEFTKAAAANTWTWEAQVGGGPTVVGTGTITFDSVGDVATGTTGTASVTTASGGVTNGATSPQAIALDFSQLSQYAATSEVQATNQDGVPPGSLLDINIDEVGLVSAVFSNGQRRPLAQLAIANFANLQGLQREEGNLFRASANTGSPQIVRAGSAGAGTIQSQTLERSNVDLAQELTQLIILQRGYQAATRLVSTADEMLTDAIQLKR